MRTTVHVQHFPRHLADLCEINYSFHYVLHVRDCTHRRERLQELFRVVFVQRRVDGAGRDRGFWAGGSGQADKTVRRVIPGSA